MTTFEEAKIIGLRRQANFDAAVPSLMAWLEKIFERSFDPREPGLSSAQRKKRKTDAMGYLVSMYAAAVGLDIDEVRRLLHDVQTEMHELKMRGVHL